MKATTPKSETAMAETRKRWRISARCSASVMPVWALLNRDTSDLVQGRIRWQRRVLCSSGDRPTGWGDERRRWFGRRGRLVLPHFGGLFGVDLIGQLVQQIDRAAHDPCDVPGARQVRNRVADLTLDAFLQ